MPDWRAQRLCAMVGPGGCATCWSLIRCAGAVSVMATAGGARVVVLPARHIRGGENSENDTIQVQEDAD